MRVSNRFRHIAMAGGLTALTMLAACSPDSAPTGTVSPSEGVSAKAAVTATAADVVLALGGGGVFNSPVLANESGYLTTEFWDNPSDDAGKCNIGFYAVGSIAAGCLNQAQSPKSYNNRGGYADGSYWAKPLPGEFDPAAFMFSGDFAYLVTLKGSYASETHKLGWFTIDAGGNRIRHDVPAFGTKSINSTVLIPRGTRWGIYIENGDPTTPIDYSDATGDIHAPGTEPVQQFALFANADASSFLVGIEDNPEDGVIVLGDDDFNDYILSVQPLGATFVIGDVEAHGLGSNVNFWGAQWWKNNFMSGPVSNGVASFKGYAVEADVVCGGVWSSRPGNSSNPPGVIPDNVLVIVTSTVLKSGPDISVNIKELLIVKQDGGYGPNPGHAGNGPVTQIICP